MNKRRKVVFAGNESIEGRKRGKPRASIEVFEEAFSMNSSGCMETCACGKTFVDVENQWDWVENELELLCADPKTIQLNYGVQRIQAQGVWYVIDCDCWHPVAQKIMNFLISHDLEIAKFFKLEKERRQRMADEVPEIEL